MTHEFPEVRELTKIFLAKNLENYFELYFELNKTSFDNVYLYIENRRLPLKTFFVCRIGYIAVFYYNPYTKKDIILNSLNYDTCIKIIDELIAYMSTQPSPPHSF